MNNGSKAGLKPNNRLKAGFVSFLFLKKVLWIAGVCCQIFSKVSEEQLLFFFSLDLWLADSISFFPVAAKLMCVAVIEKVQNKP